MPELSRKVRFANPVPGGDKFTSYKRALKYIKRGQAKWNADLTLLVFIGPLHEAACRAIKGENALGYDRDVNGRLATLEQMRGLPCVNPMALLLKQTKRSRRLPSAS